jgi:hypothetical protein
MKLFSLWTWIFPASLYQTNVAAAVTAAAAVGSAAISSDAASSASNAQQDAANNANQLAIGQNNLTRNDQMQSILSGQAGNKRLAYLLGLSTDPGLVGGPVAPSRQQIQDEYEAQRLASPNEVPYTRLDAADRAAFDAQVDQRYQDALRNFQTQILPNAQQDPNYGSLLRKFTANDLNNDPVYQSGLQFGLNEGEKTLNRQAAATGGLLSGATQKTIARYATDYASTKANDSRNRFVSDQDSINNRLAGIANSGQTSSGLVASSGQNTVNNVGNNILGAGNARASSYIAGANGVNNALGTGINAYQTNQLLKNMNGGGYGNFLSSNAGVMNSNGLTPNDLYTAF